MREFGVTDQYLGRQGARRCCCARGGKHLRRRPETVSRRNLPGRLSFTADDRRQRSRTRLRAARDRALLASRVGVDVRNREHDRGDPVRRKLSRSVKPFLWSKARYDPWRATRNAAGRCACSVRRRASTASCAWPWRNTSRSRFDVPQRNPTPDRCRFGGHNAPGLSAC